MGRAMVACFVAFLAFFVSLPYALLRDVRGLELYLSWIVSACLWSVAVGIYLRKVLKR